MKFNTAIRWVVLLLTLLLSSVVFGCPDKGPLERAGESIDDTVEQAGDKVEDATD